MVTQEEAAQTTSVPEPKVSGSPGKLSGSDAHQPEPLFKIRPRSGWNSVELGELWAHREIFYFLVWRDLRVRYKQTALGSLWVVLQPLSMTIIFTVFLSLLAHSTFSGVPYPAFVYVGMVSWTFFSNVVLSCSHCLLGNAHLISKVYFPRIYLPLVAVVVRLFDLAIAALIIFALILYYGFTPTWGLLFYSVLVLNLTLLAFSLGLLTAGLNVRYRDMGTVLPVLLQLLLFLSPVIYPAGIVPINWRPLFMLNPLAGILENQRAALFDLKFDWFSLFISLGITLALLIFSTVFFQKVEENMADVI